MKTNSFSLARATSLGQVPRQLHLIQRRLRWPISRSWFLRVLLLLALPVAVQAQFTFTTNSGTITITSYTGSGGAVTIPETVTGLPITAIEGFAFSYCTNLASVTIPNTFTGIGGAAFLSSHFSPLVIDWLLAHPKP